MAAVCLLVEDLFEGKVDEMELIDASNDFVADCAQFARLPNGLLEAFGEPHFPDLDALRAHLSPAKSES